MAHPRSEREHTDESLRLEREMSDRSASDKLAAIDQTADAVIRVARARADEVLAAARAKTDQQESGGQAASSSSSSLATERKLEDQAVREERAAADEVLSVERSEQSAHFAVERVETDKDLFSERARSDASLATRDEFLGVVSHDLRNMLNGIIGFAGLIEEGAREHHDEAMTHHAERIQRSGARMSRLVGDLVDIASIQAGRLEVTPTLGDVGLVLHEAVDTFRVQASARGISLVTEVVAPLPAVEFDAARLLQVLVNLLSNAVKFTPPEGRITVRLERIGMDLRFTFKDTGSGIPESELVAIFERFHQVDKSDRRGVGLGLYISKCIVQGHGGRIWAESTVGTGSSFCFTLPLPLPLPLPV